MGKNINAMRYEMSRVYNFSAGPSCLPEDVLKECAAETMELVSL